MKLLYLPVARLGKNIPIDPKTWLLCAIGLAVVGLAFALALALPVPPGVGNVIKYGRGLPALGLVIILWFLYSWECRPAALVRLACVMLLVTVSLSWLWQSDPDAMGNLGGILPISDASTYVMDAIRLIHGASFSPVSSYRPMSTGFMAVLIKATGGDFKLLVAVLSFLTAISIYALGEEVKRVRGPLVAAATLVVMFLFFRIYIGKALTEALGVTFACLAFVALLKSVRKKEPTRAVFGLSLFTLAMMVRAGAYFAIPTLLVWAAYHFRQNRWVSWKVLLAGGAVVAIGFACNSFLLRFIGAKDAVPFANFADSLYGLAAGYKGWLYIREVHPDITAIDKYNYTFQLIQTQPQLLLQGIKLAYLDFLSPGATNVFTFMGFHYGNRSELEKNLGYLPVFLIAAAGIAGCLKRRDAWAGILFAGWVGMLASVPFVPPIDAGIRPYAVTIPLVAFLLGEGFSWIAGLAGARTLPSTSQAEMPDWPLALGIALIPIVVLGPILVKNFPVPIQRQKLLPCEAGEESLYLLAVKNARIDVISDDSPGTIFRPQMRQTHYQVKAAACRAVPQEVADRLAALAAGQSLQYAVDLGAVDSETQPLYLIIDSAALPSDMPLFRACATHFAVTASGHVYVASKVRPPLSRNGP